MILTFFKKSKLQNLKLGKITMALSLLILISIPLDAAQHLYTRFKDPVKVEKFQQVTDQLICQCGCQMPLSSCNHVTCFAWTMRSVIEYFIEQKLPVESIVAGFSGGFKNLVDEHPNIFAKMDKNLKENFRAGWGNKILNKPNDIVVLLLIIASGLLLFIAIIWFIKKKSKTLEESQESTLSDEEQTLYDNFDD